jgi:hypothetical protein
VSGWIDHGAGDFSDNHHYANPECGTPWHSNASFDPSRIGFQGEFGGTGHNVSGEHLWKVEDAIKTINETYEMYETLETWNLRGLYLLNELRSQVEMYSCAGGVWTQTTDVEGEINGLLTYDRRILRTDVPQWRVEIQVSSLSDILNPTVSYCLRYGGVYCTIHGIVHCTLISIRLCTTHLRAVQMAQPKANFVQTSTSTSTNIHSTGHEEEAKAASVPLALILTYSFLERARHHRSPLPLALPLAPPSIDCPLWTWTWIRSSIIHYYA